ncbi:MAG: biopolymer transporter ExbD [Deltaproteobacteria bacterium]|nr:biopolymer transporter ExbD [Deltaproteobacteria bacterium]MBW1718162.1 biopolymer transporter ExbD [Deltaproteobacteria bacterium]MBW1932230.1 biopolymer transporter ExbD [Deltaproteobacteria bacterium]MBW1937188.1 biopolymer transporter ExbD [Deltaproteobacteria bacterium]MBW1964012.1 biopolymer transporter ExbD [Deltaproteobacteria bacterium]
MISSGYENRKARIEMLPLIDVVFLLLVFFIYAMLSMVVHRGLRVELPSASTSEVDRNEYISITIAKDNSIFVHKEPVDLSKLNEKVMEQVDKKPDIPVFISGDSRADLGIAIRVLDLLKSVGIKDVSFECAEEEQ